MSSNKRGRASKRDIDLLAKIDAKLGQLVHLNDAQTTRMIPEIPDIPPVILSRRKIHTVALEYMFVITSNSLTENSAAIAVSLSSAAGYLPYTQIFDQYRIAHVKVVFNPSGTVPAANAAVGDITTAIDTNDAMPLTSDVLQKKETSMTVPVGNKYFERRITPAFASAAYNGTLSTAYAESKGWVDVSSPSASWYALKYSQSISSTAQTPWKVSVTMIVNFRSIK